MVLFFSFSTKDSIKWIEETKICDDKLSVCDNSVELKTATSKFQESAALLYNLSTFLILSEKYQNAAFLTLNHGKDPFLEDCFR